MLSQIDSKKSGKVLLFAYINSHFPEMIRLAEKFNKGSQYRPIVVFVAGYDGAEVKEEFISHCQRAKISLINDHGTKVIKRKGTMRTQFKDRIISKYYQSLFVQKLYRYVWGKYKNIGYNFFISQKIKNINRLFKSLSPKLSILPEANVCYHTEIIIKTGRQFDAPTIVIPYTIANESEAAEHLFYNPKYFADRGFFNRFIAWLYPKWVYQYQERNLLLLPWSQIFAIELFKISPPNPWIVNSGNYDFLIAESLAMKKYHLTNKISKKQVVLIGSVSNDVLYRNSTNTRANRSSLYRELGINNSKPMLLCAFPPPWFPREGCEFNSYKEMADFWMGVLSKTKNYNIVVNFHPRVDYNKIKYIENKYKVKIAKKDIIELIPLCDIYVANVSATIRWAIACAKPVINYDVYKYHFNEYKDVKGVVILETKKEFAKYISLITSNKKVYKYYQNKQKKIAPMWGMLDGKSGKRLLNLTDNLIKTTGIHVN